MSRLSDDESSLERSFNASTRSNGHRNPLRHARSSNSLGSVKPQVESSISETVILEQRDKFTVSFVEYLTVLCSRHVHVLLLVTCKQHHWSLSFYLFFVNFFDFQKLYKVMVNEGQQNWVIYRRYRDFMLLNRKVKAFKQKETISNVRNHRSTNPKHCFLDRKKFIFLRWNYCCKLTYIYVITCFKILRNCFVFSSLLKLFLASALRFLEDGYFETTLTKVIAKCCNISSAGFA